MSPTDTKPAFSFAGLSIKDTAMPASAASESKGKDNPVVPQLRASASVVADKSGSWEGKARGVVVPARNVGELVNLIRGAAEFLGYGSKIRYVKVSTGDLLRFESVGATTDPVTGKNSGGKMTVLNLDGTTFGGNVEVVFAEKNRKAKAAA